MVTVKKVEYTITYVDDDGKESVAHRVLDSSKTRITVNHQLSRGMAHMWGDDPRPVDIHPDGNCRLVLTIDWTEPETQEKLAKKIIDGAKDGSIRYFNVSPPPVAGLKIGEKVVEYPRVYPPPRNPGEE